MIRKTVDFREFHIDKEASVEEAAITLRRNIDEIRMKIEWHDLEFVCEEYRVVYGKD